MAKQDGGPAFPVEEEHQHHVTGERYIINHFGISVRDYFAAAAIPGVIGCCLPHERLPDETMEQMFARKAGLVADAMLRERNRHD